MKPRKLLHPSLEHLMGDHLDQLQAHTFLESAGKPIPQGYDLTNSEIREARLLCPKSEFIDFQIDPLPEPLAARIAALPENFQENDNLYYELESILHEAERHFEIPESYYTTLNERRELWVRLDPTHP